MKKIILLITIVLAGCATRDEGPARQTLLLDREVTPMSRNEVITAIQECESNGTRPVMVYGKRRVSSHTTDVVVDVTCAPRYVPLWMR